MKREIIHSLELTEELVDMLLVAMRVSSSKILSDFHESNSAKGIDPREAFYEEKNEGIKNMVHGIWSLEKLLKELKAEMTIEKAKNN